MQLPVFSFLIYFLVQIYVSAQETVLDNFNSIDNWKIVKSDGVQATINNSPGFKGKSLEFNFNFVNGTGYCGVQKDFDLELSENFEFSFYLKSLAENNNLEFKLLDSTGNNVWWNIKRNFKFPGNWEKITIKKRDIVFAWGPATNKELRKIYKIEFTISSVNGGTGKLLIDSLTYRNLPLPPKNPPPIKINASSFVAKFEPELAFDLNPQTKWLSSNQKKERNFIIFDFGYPKEVGGLVIRWDNKYIPKNFEILTSSDKVEWKQVFFINNNRREVSFIQLQKPVMRFLQISIPLNKDEKAVGIYEVEFKDYRFSENNNYFFETVAQNYPKGIFPRYFYNEQTYWTVIGTNSDENEALLNEDGMIEVDKQNFSISPFIKTKEKILTWNNTNKTVNLSNNYLPIPSVSWERDNLKLTISPFAYGEPESSVLFAKYVIKNNGSKKKNISFYLTFRPFQVNPPWQSLNFQGGFTPLQKVRVNQNSIEINNKQVFFTSKPQNISLVDFNALSMFKYLTLEDNAPANSSSILNPMFSIVAEYEILLEAGEQKEITVIVPFHSNLPEPEKQLKVSLAENETKTFWTDKLNSVKFTLPENKKNYIDILKANLAYILINRDENKIQPGSRTYERSWIRDGALTSTALLGFGLNEEVKKYIEWYRNFLYPSGKVPCVVDSRGPDPVDENDSNGEFIYLISQYYNFTHDTTFLRENFQYVKKSVAYINYLINQRTTSYFKTGNDSIKAFYGLVPESISHEGYSAKPMHSYWDNFFVLLGLKRAKQIANILGEDSLYAECSDMEKTFRANLIASITLSSKLHNINYIPGSVELGDFDPTSTAIAVFPCNEHNNLPPDLLKNTFEKYFEFFLKRISSNEWDNFTPYELRIVGAYIFLGQKDKALKLLDYFIKYLRPNNWNEWAEIVWQDERAPKFIGDMPHTWVGSGFINSLRTFFVYEDEIANSLVLASGITEDWIDKQDGLSVYNLPTYFGKLSYSIKRKKENVYSISLKGLEKLPQRGIIIKNFTELPIKSVYVNDKKYKNYTNSEIVIKNKLPVKLKIFF